VIPGGGTVPLASLGGVASVLEFVGGLFLLPGLFTRPVAFILSGEMAFAYFIGHAPGGFWPSLNGGGGAIYYCFTFLYLSAAGGGPWSLHGAIRRSHSGSTV
jgi:putative oxidoreductase